MNTNDWNAIPEKLHQAGFHVTYSRISYAPGNPLWRAQAKRDGKEWTCMGKNLESALVELERQTQEPASDWRELRKTA